MSQLQINEYLKQLALLKKVSGEQRESIVREAFKDLLKGWGRQHDLVFIPEYSLDTLTKEKRYVDGALVYELRMPWTELGVEGRFGTKLGCSLQLNDNDGAGRAAFISWGDGLSPAWAPTQMGVITLVE